MEIESRKYNMTPAKTLLIFLGNKGFRSSDLIAWFQVMGLEKALAVLKSEGNNFFLYYKTVDSKNILQ